jgi:hypothetical protein
MFIKDDGEDLPGKVWRPSGYMEVIGPNIGEI